MCKQLETPPTIKLILYMFEMSFKAQSCHFYSLRGCSCHHDENIGGSATAGQCNEYAQYPAGRALLWVNHVLFYCY